MFQLKVVSFVLWVSLFAAEAKGECDISGIWNHSSKPAKLFIDSGTGEISVYSHADNTKAIGLVVLKNLVSGSTFSSWNAKMYNAAEDSFVDVHITSTRCNQLSVSFNNEVVLELLR